MSGIGFLGVPEPSAGAQRLFDDDMSELGYVMNVSGLWAYQPATFNGLFDLIRESTSAHGLDVGQRGILVAACASALGDSYCSLAWGKKLAAATDAHKASAVIRGDDEGLTAREAAMADWARKVARDPNGTSGADVQAFARQASATTRSSRSRCSSRYASRSRPSTMHSAPVPMRPCAPRRPKPFWMPSPSAGRSMTLDRHLPPACREQPMSFPSPRSSDGRHR